MAAQPDWDQLLLASEDLVLRENQGFPRVERDALQIEQFSQKLRSKASHIDATSEALDASRLLAQEGLNPRRLKQAMQTLQLRPTYEDVFQVETSSVEEYLQQVHQSITATAVQHAQRSTAAAFEQFMDKSLQSKWEEEKRALLESVGPFSVGPTTRTPGPSPRGHLSPYSRTPYSGVPATPQSAGPAYRGTPFPGRGGPGAGAAPTTPGGGMQLRGKAAKYAEVVKAINQAAASKQSLEAVEEFAAACVHDVAGEKRTSMQRVWQVLERLLGGVAALPPSAKSQRLEALVSGGVRYLEQNYVDYMQNVVHTHRMQAALGGSPSRLSLVQAFLRVREKERGPLDFDQPGGVDTTWQRIYCCLRAGFQVEALQVARSCKEAATPRAGAVDYGSALQEWGQGGQRPLSGKVAAELAQECERLLRDRAARARQPFYGQRVMAHAVLCGNNRAAEQVVKEFPSFFPTIEDYLWLKLRLVRGEGRGGASAAVGAGYYEVYTLADLQQYLQQFPSGHYSHNGKEPLLHVIVLLLTLQFRGAVSFLSQDPSTRDHHLDGVHLGICLHSYGVLGISGDTDSASSTGGLDLANLVHRYGRNFVHTDAELALEYYMLAASIMGGSAAVKGQLLRELLVESKAYGFLLGSGGSGEGGALARFVPDVAERGRVLEAVAQECAAAAQFEEAVELFMFAGRPRRALRILNHMLGDLAATQAQQAQQGGVVQAEAVSTLVSRGNDAAAALGAATSSGVAGTRDPADLFELEAFEQLKVVVDMLAASARGDHPRVLQRLGELPFIPTERFRLQVRAAGVANLHPAVAEQLPAVLLAAATALAATKQGEQLRVVVAFAAAVPGRIPQTTYQKLNQLQASLG